MPQPETVTAEELQVDIEGAWDLEEELVDRSVKILPGVRRMIGSIPEGRYCVATSGAKTYGESHRFMLHPLLSLANCIHIWSSSSSWRYEPRRYHPSCRYNHC